MAKQKQSAYAVLSKELTTFGLYKPSLGRHVRQVTGVAITLVFAFGAYQLYNSWQGASSETTRLVTCLAIFLVGGWLGFRLVNYPRFADFLIATEAEMKKVTWPTRLELIRGTVVVLVVMFTLAIVLFVYDLIWQFIFGLLGILES